MTTANLGLPELVHRERNGEITHNESLQLLDVYSQPFIIDIPTAQPGSSVEGDRYIVGASATGTDWIGQDDKVAHFYSGVWHFYVPKTSWRFYNLADEHIYFWSGTAWLRQTFFECFGEADLLALAPAQALVAATTVEIRGYNNIAVPAVKCVAVLTPIENASRAVFTPSVSYFGTFRVKLNVSLLAPLGGIFQFFCWDGTVDHLIGTINLTADTLTFLNFSESMPLTITTAVGLEFRVQCDTAQSITYSSLNADIQRMKA